MLFRSSFYEIITPIVFIDCACIGGSYRYFVGDSYRIIYLKGNSPTGPLKEGISGRSRFWATDVCFSLLVLSFKESNSEKEFSRLTCRYTKEAKEQKMNMG
jgi:hypothetical protein